MKLLTSKALNEADTSDQRPLTFYKLTSLKFEKAETGEEKERRKGMGEKEGYFSNAL